MSTMFSESEREFIRTYNKKLVIMTILSTGFLLAILIPSYKGQIDLGRNSVPLNIVQDRLVYTLKHLSSQLAWLIISQYYVIYYRLNTPALDPTSGNEDLVQRAKNILTNSVEHGLVFMLSQLIMSVDLSADLCRRLIPTINILYILGRFLYLLGYPNNRTFGFVIVNLIIILTVSYNLCQLSNIYL